MSDQKLMIFPCFSSFIIINNQPTETVQRPVGWNTMKIGLSSSTCPGLYGI